MESIAVKNLSFTYPHRTDAALRDVTFSVGAGEFVLLCGKSGCGKTTLLRLLKPSLAPFGKMHGSIRFEGREASFLDAREQAARIGFVMQNPENQIVTDTVWHELAFGLESLGYTTPEIRARVSEMASFFGIQNWFYKKVTELSGGQKQLLNLASVMVQEPSVLILDEPTSQLDPIAAGEFLKILEKINRELGVTVILTEHRLEEAFPFADRVLVMEEGKIIADAAPGEIGEILKVNGNAMYRALPTPVRVHSAVPNSLPCPVSVREGRAWLSEYTSKNAVNADAIPKDAPQRDGETVLEIKGAWFRYEKEMPDVIKDLNLQLKKSELFCILGGNGTGKTTALSLAAGLYRPYRGEVLIKGQSISKIWNLYHGFLGVLPQNPESVFTRKTVHLDLREMLAESTLSQEEQEAKIQEVAALCKIEKLLEYHPYDLSGGEKERAALAKILLAAPEILLLDEPTKGMDAAFKEEFAGILSVLRARGVAVLMVSHDIEFCAAYADRCALFFDGAITSEGTPRTFFSGKHFYTTAANRMARHCLPDAVLAEDVILALGGKRGQDKKTPTPKSGAGPKEKDAVEYAEAPESRAKQKQGTFPAPFWLFLLIPFTLYFGNRFLGARKYYILSFLLLAEAMIPFGMAFERRKPRARELVLVSALCAIAVSGRAAFFMLPEFKPTLALVVLSGVCFGGETGFLVGAVTAFVSNFFFGQGPWTPWQMFSLGIIGFIAGVLSSRKVLGKNKIFLCIFGFLTALFIYGGIMNPASVIMWQNKITWEMLAAAYIAGAPVDLIHASATAFFLWLITDPMLEKLERIKAKYGLMTG